MGLTGRFCFKNNNYWIRLPLTHSAQKHFGKRNKIQDAFLISIICYSTLNPNLDWIQENEILLSDKKIYWKDICDFYRNCIGFYNKQLQVEKAQVYEKRLADFWQVSQVTGIIMYSQNSIKLAFMRTFE